MDMLTLVTLAGHGYFDDAEEDPCRATPADAQASASDAHRGEDDGAATASGTSARDRISASKETGTVPVTQTPTGPSQPPQDSHSSSDGVDKSQPMACNAAS